jgi:Fic family protein
MLESVKQTSKETIVLVGEIRALMDKYKREIRSALPKIYSKDLLENLFKHPYTKIDYLQEDLMCSRNTAISYLKQLADAEFLVRYKVGKSTFYLNEPLFNLFVNKKNPM